MPLIAYAGLAQQVALEERVARVEGALEQMNLRLGNLETEVRELRREIGDLRRLMLQIFIPMWVTIILAILAVMLRV